MKQREEPLTKQQLFVNPIKLLEKQAKANQNTSNHQKSNLEEQISNFNEILIQTVLLSDNDSSHNKNKIITKRHIAALSSSIQNNKQKNYRTRMCPEGRECKKRLVCTFAHNQYQLRRPYKNRKNPCIRYQKGLCSLGAACPDYHGNMDLKKKNYKYKTQKCKEWSQIGTCSKGKLCIFIHDEDENLIEESESHLSILQEQQNEHQKREESILAQDSKKKQEQKSETKVKKMTDIFNKKSQSKKLIIVEEIIQQIGENKQQQNQNEEENFNIQFNF